MPQSRCEGESRILRNAIAAVVMRACCSHFLVLGCVTSMVAAATAREQSPEIAAQLGVSVCPVCDRLHSAASAGPSVRQTSGLTVNLLRKQRQLVTQSLRFGRFSRARLFLCMCTCMCTREGIIFLQLRPGSECVASGPDAARLAPKIKSGDQAGRG